MTKGSNNNYKSAGPKNQFFIHFLLVRRILAMHFARETFFFGKCTRHSSTTLNAYAIYNQNIL